MTEMNTPSPEQIEALMSSADKEGDAVTVAICRAALGETDESAGDGYGGPLTVEEATAECAEMLEAIADKMVD